MPLFLILNTCFIDVTFECNLMISLQVRLAPSRPLSRRKRWIVAEIVKKEKVYVRPKEATATDVTKNLVGQQKKL